MDTSLPASLRDGILAAVGQAMIATDLTGRVLYWNAAAEQLYGYEASQGSVVRLLPREETVLRPLAATRA